MLRLAGVAISVGLADSLNPSTVAPALYLATAQRAVRQVLLFTLGVFAVDLLAGVALTVGPGKLLLALLPHPNETVRHVIELIAGVLLLAAAAALWTGRRRLTRRELPMRGGGSALIVGATVAAIELPSAVPYFAVIAGIVAADANVVQSILVLVLYCVAFVAPLLAIVVVLLVAGERAQPWLERGGDWVQRRWPVVLACLLLLVGSALTMLGGVGLLKQ